MTKKGKPEGVTVKLIFEEDGVVLLPIPRHTLEELSWKAGGRV